VAQTFVAMFAGTIFAGILCLVFCMIVAPVCWINLSIRQTVVTRGTELRAPRDAASDVLFSAVGFHDKTLRITLKSTTSN
jgi:hypothetical protein